MNSVEREENVHLRVIEATGSLKLLSLKGTNRKEAMQYMIGELVI